MARHVRVVLIAGISMVVACGSAVIIVLQRTAYEETELRRYERGESQVLVSSHSETRLELLRAGNDLKAAVKIEADWTNQLWLSPGRYFLRAQFPGTDRFYPISVVGYRRGDDREGAIHVTVRSPSSEVPPTVGGLLPPFVSIPSSWFRFGDRTNPNESHGVWLTTYFIGQFETTNQAFRAFFESPDGYIDDSNWTEEGVRWKTSNRSRTSAILAPSSSEYRRSGQPDQPVTWITWFEANAYCRWLTRTIGRRQWWFALPTEAEWEKAARGPDGFDYGLGMQISDAEMGSYNWKKNPSSDTTVVGVELTRQQFVPNRFGIYHATGNVTEWTQSLYRSFNREHPYREYDDRNRDDGIGLRVARGGSWYSASIANLSNAYRESFQPEHSTQEVGFRIVVRKLP